MQVVLGSISHRVVQKIITKALYYMKVYVPSFLKINSLLFRHDLVSVEIHGTSKQSAFGGSGHKFM